MSRTPTSTGTIRHTNSQGSSDPNDVVETEVKDGAAHTSTQSSSLNAYGAHIETWSDGCRRGT